VVNPASSGIGGGAFILVHGDWSHHHGKINHEAYEEPKFIDLRDDTVAKEGQSRRPTPNGKRTTGRKRGKKVTEFIDGRGESNRNDRRAFWWIQNFIASSQVPII
jgi:hypothetical protein